MNMATGQGDDEIYIEINGRMVRCLKKHKTNPDYTTDKQQVFIIGSKGIPAAYGGFEAFVENLTWRQVSSQIRYHVAHIGKEDFRYEYNGAKCFEIRVPEIGPARAIYYDVIALKYCIDYCKARPVIKDPIFYVLACRIGPFVGYFKREIQKLGGKLYINPDGHEWLRAKWSTPVKRYWKYSEDLMVKYADLLICDSISIEKYIQDTYKHYNPRTRYIAYGSDTSSYVETDKDERFNCWLLDHGLRAEQYYLIVGRFVPENNYTTCIRELMNSGTEKDLVIITTPNPKLLHQLERELHFEKDKRIKFVGSIYDNELLKKIRENAYGYLHGHEVGGTNPSLLEALGSTKVNLLLKVGFNKEVARNAALYWTKEEGSLSCLIDYADKMTAAEREEMGYLAKKRIRTAYSWEFIVEQYESLFTKKSNP